MAIEDWADELTSLWGQIEDGMGGNVKSYSMIDKRDFPEKIEKFPCALTFIEDLTSVYGLGSTGPDVYRGITEFHLTKDTNKENYPDLYKFFKRIRNKAGTNMQLNSSLGGGDFLLDFEGRPGIEGPLTLQYGDEAPHLGLVVNWVVRENVNGEYQPATGVFLPTDIAGLLLWLTADEGLFVQSDGTIAVEADGDLVGTWEDQSGNNNDFIQSTSSKKPEFKTSQINGQDVVRFDGIDNLLVAPGFLSGEETGSVFITYQLTAPLQSNETLFMSGSSVDNNKFLALDAAVSAADPSMRYRFQDLPNIDTLQGDTNFIAATPSLSEWHSDGDTIILRVDGEDEIINITVGANSGRWFGDAGLQDRITLGSLKRGAELEGQHFKGDIRQIVQYDTNLTGDDLASVESFLADDAGIILP